MRCTGFCLCLACVCFCCQLIHLPKSYSSYTRTNDSVPSPFPLLRYQALELVAYERMSALKWVVLSQAEEAMEARRGGGGGGVGGLGGMGGDGGGSGGSIFGAEGSLTQGNGAGAGSLAGDHSRPEGINSSSSLSSGPGVGGENGGRSTSRGSGGGGGGGLSSRDSARHGGGGGGAEGRRRDGFSNNAASHIGDLEVGGGSLLSISWPLLVGGAAGGGTGGSGGGSTAGRHGGSGGKATLESKSGTLPMPPPMPQEHQAYAHTTPDPHSSYALADCRFDLYLTRLMHVVIGSITKLGSRCLELAPRAQLCLAKIINHRMYLHPSVTDRAHESVRLLHRSSIAASIFTGPSHILHKVPSSVDETSALPFLLHSTADYVPGEPLHDFSLDEDPSG